MKGAQQSNLFAESDNAGAVISPCGRYRYLLWRRWGPGWSMTWLMLNPSTADAEVDDATVRKCIGFAKRWRYDEIRVVNLFAFRATDPGDLLVRAGRGEDIVGPENDAHITEAIIAGRLVVPAWGNDSAADIGGRAAAVMRRLYSPPCLGQTSRGAPRHPLMLPYVTPLVRFEPRRP